MHFALRGGLAVILLLALAAVPALAQPLNPEQILQQQLAEAQLRGDVKPFGFFFLVFSILVAALIGRWVWSLRQDFFSLLRPSDATAGISTERLTLFRDAQAGLPEGTIRAAISLLVVVICLPALVLSKMLGLTSTGEIGTILGGVLGFYFGTRSSAGEGEGFRRQAETLLGQNREREEQARTAEVGRETAEAGRQQAEAALGEVVQQAESRIATARQDAVVETTAGAEQLAALAARARDALAVAGALGSLLPAGGLATAVNGGLAAAGSLLEDANRAGTAVQAAMDRPDADTVATAIDAARDMLRRAGEGTDLADRLGSALEVLRDATAAAGRVQAAIRDPSPASVGEAVSAAGEVLSRTGGGGFVATLAPALGAIGTAMRMPGLSGLLAASPPSAIVGGILLGAWQAWTIGAQHYARWMARVLDRPVTPELFPAAAWDGAAARVLLGRVPTLARVFRAELEDAPQQAMADLLGRLFRADAAADILGSPHGVAFHSAPEAETAIADLRRLVLEAELARDTGSPLALPAGASMPQAEFHTALDRLREAGAGGAIETLGLLANRLLRARPTDSGGTAAAVDLPRLVAEALPLAAADPAARPAEPPPAPPAVEGEPLP